MTRVAIDGFGRMGRLALRAAWGRPHVELVHVNELHGDAEVAAHLLVFDSVHGRWQHDARATGDGAGLAIDGQVLGFSRHAAPADVPWDDAGVDIVLECTGRFRTIDRLAPYFERGVRKVIVAAPVKDERALNVVMGVNDGRYDPATHDASPPCVFEVARKTDIDDINALLRVAAGGPLDGILGYETRPLVSIDFRTDPRSGIVDAPSTNVVDGTQFEVLAWYDNEWGYADRVVELAAKVTGSLPAVAHGAPAG